MTPAEMREMAAKACDKVSDGDVECLNQAPDDLRRHYHAGGRDAAAMCARIVRAIPIPDTTAADEARIKELWRNLLEKDDRTSPAEYPDMALITFDEFREALAAIDAAKAKGGG